MSANTEVLCSQLTAACEQISRAIDAFDIACKPLGTMSVHAAAALESAQPDFLLSIDTILSLLPQEAARITGKPDKLKKLRNGSTEPVPINRLPSELLAYTFSIAVHTSRATPPPWVHKESRPDFANIISSVSACWRNVSLGKPIPWAEITLTLQGGANQAALWLERSRSCPLHFRSLEHEYGDREQDLVDLVRRHSNRFRSLVLNLDNNVAQRILYNTCNQRDDAAVALEPLATSISDPIARNNIQQMNLPSKHHMDEFLMSIRSLYVSFKLFGGCTLRSFHNLTALNLPWIESSACPTYGELLDVLSASPKLHSLELASLDLGPAPLQAATPASLLRPEIVWLHAVSHYFAMWLLQSIIPHPDGLTLALYDVMDWDQPAIGFELPLSIPDRVKSLCIQHGTPEVTEVDLSGLLKCLTSLETLALKDLSIRVVNSNINSGDSQHPILTALDLVPCEVTDVFQFKAMLARYSIRRLRVCDCRGFPTMDELVEALPDLIVNTEPGAFLTMFSPFE